MVPYFLTFSLEMSISRDLKGVSELSNLRDLGSMTRAIKAIRKFSKHGLLALLTLHQQYTIFCNLTEILCSAVKFSTNLECYKKLFQLLSGFGVIREPRKELVIPELQQLGVLITAGVRGRRFVVPVPHGVEVSIHSKVGRTFYQGFQVGSDIARSQTSESSEIDRVVLREAEVLAHHGEDVMPALLIRDAHGNLSGNEKNSPH